MTNNQTKTGEIHPLTQRVQELFEIFSKKVPRRSANEEAAAIFVSDFANDLKSKGIVAEVIYKVTETPEHRAVRNVIVKKPSTLKDGKKHAPVILQAHMDMVCEPAEGSHDFDVKPINIYEEVDEHGVTWMKASLDDGKVYRTTLGADDGIGVACILALLESDLPHPPIEAVFTSDEEAEMSGAEYLDGSELSAKRMINIDTEKEGVFFNGCAGGINLTLSIPIKTDTQSEKVSYNFLKVSGLTGGHSGLKMGQNLANANRLMGRALDTLQTAGIGRIYLYSLDGGNYPNAIPTECTALIGVEPGQQKALENNVEKLLEIFREEYKGTEKGLNLTLALTEPDSAEPLPVWNQEMTSKLTAALMLVPNDVIAMHSEVEGLVETSSNIGIIQENKTNKTIEIVCFARSCFESKKQMVRRQFELIKEYTGIDLKISSNFPAWAPDESSRMKRVLENTYAKVFPNDPKAKTMSIHAGLECGYFIAKIEGLDCIAIGPTIEGAHTTDEKLQKDTIDKVVRLLIKVLEDIDNEEHDIIPNRLPVAHKHGEEHVNCMCVK